MSVEGQPLNHCHFTTFSLPTRLPRFEKVNKSVCLKVRLLVSSSVERFVAGFGCFYNYLSDEEYIPSSEAPQIYRSSLGGREGERARERESKNENTRSLLE